MNKKNLQILLAGAMIIIWGRIIWRMIENVSWQNSHSGVQTEETILPLVNTQDQHFELLGSYPDPFHSLTGKASSDMTASDNPNPAPTPPNKPIKSPETPLIWPDIRFVGIVKDVDQKGKQLALVSINNRTYSLLSGQEKEHIKVTKIYKKDSFEVSYKGQSKLIKK